jgi:hypothetical protein
MTIGEIAFLTCVISAFLIFMAGVAYASWCTTVVKRAQERQGAIPPAQGLPSLH